MPSWYSSADARPSPSRAFGAPSLSQRERDWYSNLPSPIGRGRGPRRAAAWEGEGDGVKAYARAPSGTVDRARRLRRDATDAEKRLWRALREKLPAAKFRRQSPVGPFFADFLSFRLKLIVELD